MLTDMTARQAKATGKPYTIADFDGLSLFVSANGARALALPLHLDGPTRPHLPR
jgi:hypothetical protein